MSSPHFLLTNDDGIDAPGLASLYEAFSAVGDVTVVAPAEDQSGVGRTRNDRAVRRSHPWGYALAGTPADCVAYGLRGLDESFDLVVSGVNSGPNAGNYVVGRSGTVGAGIEAVFLGTPALAVSAYHAEDFFCYPAEEYDFDRPARVARELIDRALDDGTFREPRLVSVNAPVDVAEPRFRVTHPYADYDQHVEHANADGGGLGDDEAVVRLHDRTWPGVVGWENPFPLSDDQRERYPVGSDRRALVDGEVSVSPLSVADESADEARVARLVERLNGE